jgi:hypothetical protein
VVGSAGNAKAESKRYARADECYSNFAVATYLLLYISAPFWGLFSDIELTKTS